MADPLTPAEQDLVNASLALATRKEGAFSKLARLRREAAAKAAARAKLDAAPKNVQILSQQTTDVTNVNESRRNARAIGTLDGVSSLTINATLSNVNNADNFSFSVAKNMSTVKLTLKATGSTIQLGKDSAQHTSDKEKNNVGYATMQVFDGRGNLIADSSPNATTEQKDAWQALRTGEMELEKGTYTLRVGRAPGVLNNKKVIYAAALTTGSEKRTYATKQMDADPRQVTRAFIPGQSAIDIWDVSTSKLDGKLKSSSSGSMFDYWS